MLDIILWAAGMIIAGIVLMLVLADKVGGTAPPPASRPNRPSGGRQRRPGGEYAPRDDAKDTADAGKLADPGVQPPANRIIPVTLFAVLVTGTYGKTPKLGQMIGERIVKESAGAWEVAALKEKATIIIPVFVQPFFGKDERIEFAYDGEMVGGEVFFRNAKNYKFALYPNEADIFVSAAKKIAEDILREHAIFAAKQTQSS